MDKKTQWSKALASQACQPVFGFCNQCESRRKDPALQNYPDLHMLTVVRS